LANARISDQRMATIVNAECNSQYCTSSEIWQCAEPSSLLFASIQTPGLWAPKGIGSESGHAFRDDGKAILIIGESFHESTTESRVTNQPQTPDTHPAWDPKSATDFPGDLSPPSGDLAHLRSSWHCVAGKTDMTCWPQIGEIEIGQICSYHGSKTCTTPGKPPAPVVISQAAQKPPQGPSIAAAPVHSSN
jgi:hypothetical protein